MPKEKSDTFTQKEIATSINNAIVFAKAPNRLGVIVEDRLRRLRNYSEALFAPLDAEIEDEYLRPEEAVLICLCGALYMQMKHVMGTDKIPMSGTAKAALEKQ